MAESLAEAKYLLRRALQTRGFVALDEHTGNGYRVKGWFATFRLTFMPGNRRVLVSSDVTIDEGYRGKGQNCEQLRSRNIRRPFR